MRDTEKEGQSGEYVLVFADVAADSLEQLSSALVLSQGIFQQPSGKSVPKVTKMCVYLLGFVLIVSALVILVRLILLLLLFPEKHLVQRGQRHPLEHQATHRSTLA